MTTSALMVYGIVCQCIQHTTDVQISRDVTVGDEKQQYNWL